MDTVVVTLFLLWAPNRYYLLTYTVATEISLG